MAGGTVVHQLQFYVHDIELVDQAGGVHPVRIDGALALIDLTGSGKTRVTSVPGTLTGKPPSSYRAVRFTVGVPFALNHANPLTAAPPLDRGELFWAWQSGYKFLRADFVADGLESTFHLGSAGCSSASALRPPASPCAQPNLVRVELAGDALKSVVRFHPEVLGAGRCTGNYADNPDCFASYAATGLDIATGKCLGGSCASQRLWTLE